MYVFFQPGSHLSRRGREWECDRLVRCLQPYIHQVQPMLRARICKRLRSPGIGSKESILQAYVAWWAGAPHRVVVPARKAGNRFMGSLKRFKNCVLMPAELTKVIAREYWTIYRGPGFLRLRALPLLPTPSSVIKEDWERETNLLMGEVGKGVGVESNNTTARNTGTV
jgi:hypothetical protein